MKTSFIYVLKSLIPLCYGNPVFERASNGSYLEFHSGDPENQINIVSSLKSSLKYLQK